MNWNEWGFSECNKNVNEKFLECKKKKIKINRHQGGLTQFSKFLVVYFQCPSMLYHYLERKEAHTSS